MNKTGKHRANEDGCARCCGRGLLGSGGTGNQKMLLAQFLVRFVWSKTQSATRAMASSAKLFSICAYSARKPV